MIKLARICFLLRFRNPRVRYRAVSSWGAVILVKKFVLDCFGWIWDAQAVGQAARIHGLSQHDLQRRDALAAISRCPCFRSDFQPAGDWIENLSDSMRGRKAVP